MNKRLSKILNNFKGKKIGAIGDLMLDHFIWGDAERISPEAPVPIVLVKKETFALGGAANVANNMASLGAKVFAVGMTGADKEGGELVNLLNDNRIDSSGILESKEGPTILKTRIIAGEQQVVRMDREEKFDISKETEKKILDFINSHIKNWHGLVISDYGKGFIVPRMAKRIIDLAKCHQKLIIGSVKPKHALFLKNIDFLTLNLKEAREISGMEDLRKAGRALQKRLRCNVLITQGSEGMTIFEENKIKHLPTKAKEVFDVVGAGDTVLAALSLALVSGANFGEAAMIANHAAGIAVGKAGTATVYLKELRKVLENNG